MQKKISVVDDIYGKKKGDLHDFIGDLATGEYGTTQDAFSAFYGEIMDYDDDEADFILNDNLGAGDLVMAMGETDANTKVMSKRGMAGKPAKTSRPDTKKITGTKAKEVVMKLAKSDLAVTKKMVVDSVKRGVVPNDADVAVFSFNKGLIRNLPLPINTSVPAMQIKQAAREFLNKYAYTTKFVTGTVPGPGVLTCTFGNTPDTANIRILGLGVNISGTALNTPDSITLPFSISAKGEDGTPITIVAAQAVFEARTNQHIFVPYKFINGNYLYMPIYATGANLCEISVSNVPTGMVLEARAFGIQDEWLHKFIKDVA